jgi:uncharacterized protein (DUF2062 family)
MAVLVATGQNLSTAAYTKTANLATGQYEFVGKGKITLAATCSAIGLNCSLSVGGVTIVNDLAIPFVRAVNLLSLTDHVITSQVMNGGRIEFVLRNTTAGALTSDFGLYFEPM